MRKAGKNIVGETLRTRACGLVGCKRTGDLSVQAGVGEETALPDLQGG